MDDLNRLDHLLNILTQCGNVLLLGGHSNESISGRCYREGWTTAMKVIDAIFFWQPQHCEKAYLRDLEWAQQIVQLGTEPNN